jgi:hypothetical protein
MNWVTGPIFVRPLLHRERHIAYAAAEVANYPSDGGTRARLSDEEKGRSAESVEKDNVITAARIFAVI